MLMGVLGCGVQKQMHHTSQKSLQWVELAATDIGYEIQSRDGSLPSPTPCVRLCVCLVILGEQP